MFFPYEDLDSRIHNLDARPKIVFVAVMFVLSILLSDILYLSFLFILVLAVAACARVLRSTIGFLKYAAFIGLFVFIFNALLSSGSEIIFEFGPLFVTVESMLFATSMCIRLFLAVGAFSLLTLAVHPDEALRLLSKLGYKTMTGLSLATRMYPTIAADSKNIMDSMRARGVEFDEGNIVQKAKSRTPVMNPLLLNSLDRAINLAEAMEARGFGSGKRSNYSQTTIGLKEKMMIVSFLVATAFGIATFIMGWGGADYLSDPFVQYSVWDAVVLLIYGALLSPIMVGDSQ